MGLITTLVDSGPNKGTYPAGVADTLTRWHATETGTSIDLTTLTGGKPNSLIIGPDDGSGKFSNANASIYQHQPEVLGSATFILTIPGVTTLSAISNVFLEFGTEGLTGLATCTDCNSNGPGTRTVLAGGAAFGRWRKGRKLAA